MAGTARAATREEGAEAGAHAGPTTADALRALPGESWRVFHDVPWRGRGFDGIDHVLVGPEGVFVVGRLTWDGDVETGAGVLRHDGRRQDGEAASVAAAAAAVRELVPQVDPETIRPVLCLVRDQPEFGWVGEVMVCSTANVATMLTSRPRVLDEARVHETAVLVQSVVRWGARPGAGRPPGSHPARRGRRRSRRASGLVRSAAAIVALGVVAVLALTVVVPGAARLLHDRAVARLHAGAAVGETVPVQGNPLRPGLRLRVLRAAWTRTLGPRHHRVYAAEVMIRNVGDEAWSSRRGGAAFAVVDAADARHARDRRPPPVAAGRLLPAQVKVPPGRARRGILVFAVPRGRAVTALEVTVGPGLPATVHWDVRRP